MSADVPNAILTAWQQGWVKRDPENECSRAIIAALVKYKARVTGSWARAETTENSDFDFYVSKALWKKFVKDAPNCWDSCVVGHISWRRPDLNVIEVSKMFRRQPRGKLLASVELFGRVWRTW